MALAMAAFFLASAGASSAYLTVSEVFPMETRALAIALFFAVGTATGGIVGPELFGQFIDSGNVDLVALGFFIGAAVMLIGGVTEIFLGVRAEQQSLENIARPLTAEEADAAGAEGVAAKDGSYPESENEQRIRERVARKRARERAGARRFRPGPGTGSSFYSPGMSGTVGTASRTAATAAQSLDGEIEAVAADLTQHGESDSHEIEQRLGGRGWGPGRFRAALLESVDEGRARQISQDRYGPPADGEPGRGLAPGRRSRAEA